MTNSNNIKAEKINRYIVEWLLHYASNANCKGFVVGVSGGIDSAVTSTLCAQTGLPTLCVEMAIHQAENQINRAKEHINQLKKRFPNVVSESTDLTPVFEQFKNQLPAIENKMLLDLALANARARLRMTTLYYLASLHDFLVVGTGNKIEDFGIGFFTKYGDGGVDISPIADLVKSEVRIMATFLQVPESIIKAKPTDGLFGDDRTDEDQIGANYDELEWAMKQNVQGKKMEDFSGREAEVFNIYSNLHKKNQHKMVPIPICKIPIELKF